MRFQILIEVDSAEEVLALEKYLQDRESRAPQDPPKPYPDPDPLDPRDFEFFCDAIKYEKDLVKLLLHLAQPPEGLTTQAIVALFDIAEKQLPPIIRRFRNRTREVWPKDDFLVRTLSEENENGLPQSRYKLAPKLAKAVVKATVPKTRAWDRLPRQIRDMLS
jgi:hypothetical protein